MSNPVKLSGPMSRSDINGSIFHETLLEARIGLRVSLHNITDGFVRYGQETGRLASILFEESQMDCCLSDLTAAECEHLALMLLRVSRRLREPRRPPGGVMWMKGDKVVAVS